MKYLLVLLAFVAISATSFAAHNDPASATSTFDCRVIQLLTWTAPNTTELEEVIAGQTRTFNAVPVKFTLTGEAGYSVKINCTGPVAVAGNPTGVVTLDGSWDFTTGNSTNLSGSMATPGTGTKDVIYSCTGITADGTAHGSYSFTLSVDAVYDAL